LDTVNEERFASMPPCQIVPALADEGKYIASECHGRQEAGFPTFVCGLGRLAGRLSAALSPLKNLREAASRAALQPPFIGEPRSGSEILDTVFIGCYL
jgi:hypothetical protein